MIDHDEAESAGLVLLDLKFILCNFHVIKAIGKKIQVKIEKKKKKSFIFFHFNKFNN
jgi:hypothetical protein